MTMLRIDSKTKEASRCAVVTGANKGIGFEICRQLASNGITVLVTARDEKKGLEAVEKLRAYGFSDQLISFHQLDVTDSASIATLANFVKTHFKKLDILINNAGIPGADVDPDALLTWIKYRTIDGTKVTPQNFEAAEATVKTNYHGAKETIEALINLLQLSDSPKIINVSSNIGRLEYMPNGWPKEVLNDVENITEEKIQNILNQFLKDLKEGSLEIKGCWPISTPAYILSKAALNALTRILAKKYPSFCINAVHPGFVKTDMTQNLGVLTPNEGAESVVRLALLPNGSPSGLFFFREKETSF
ncbi:hypothetical protein L6164_021093 [Bauhinia variegata]|uniref:Uncharacterized protein n=1 Tax=Bauhinia variegata TaxID=167791 RepID=A0ACB9MXK5_BAUVA|nr:hypothetical protein L6164_021093 [Bauhinia variegata]